MYEEATDSVFIDRKEDRDHDFDWRKECSGNADTYAETYDHPIWKKFLEEGVQGSHGGMDWLEFEQFFQCLREDSPMPVDSTTPPPGWPSPPSPKCPLPAAEQSSTFPTSPTENGLWNL